MKSLFLLQQNKIHYKNYLLLLLICMLTYWPLTFGIFSVKNDAIHYFLPYRFNIGEALRNGNWPFWSPYIYMGFPVHGDMQSGAWNPIVWLFSAIGRYNLTLFHFENLLYIFLSGAGMYKLTNRLVGHSPTAMLIAVSYMLSGFMLSGQLINWLASAAFLPFVIHYYLQTIRSSSFGYPIKTAIALFFLLTAGYPSFFIIVVYILFFLFIITQTTRFKRKEIKNSTWKKFLLQNLLIALVFSGLALPAIVSFIDLLPYYNRGNGVAFTDSVQNSFEWQHLLSLLFPSSIKANDVVSGTDITCRNIYMGLFPLIILAAFPPRLTRRNILLISFALFALLFSLGDATPVRKICYDLIPLMDTFRHPSQMRLYFIFALLLLTAPGLKQFLVTGLNSFNLKRIKYITWTITGLLLIITAIALFQSDFVRKLAVLHFSQIRVTAKSILDSISLSDAIAMNGIIQLIFLGLFLLLIRKSFISKTFFSFLWITNLFVMAQLVLPATFVSKTSPAEINSFIDASPKGFPLKDLDKSIAENSRDATSSFDKIALTYFYNKKEGISHITNSPSFLEEQEQFLKSDILYNYVSSQPVVYMAGNIVSLKDSILLTQPGNCKYAIIDSFPLIKNSCHPGDTAFIKKLSANRFEIETETSAAGLLVLTQNYHHHWKVWVDGVPGNIYKTNISFMGTPVPPGKHKIVFRFIPSNTINAMWIMFTTAILLIISGIVSLIKQRKPGYSI